MQTLLFIEAVNPRFHGFQLSRKNFNHVPEGRIRIARYDASFDPERGRGYYGDIYFRRFIRRWKNIAVIKKRRLMERSVAALCLNVLCNRNSVIGDRTVLVTDVMEVIGTCI